MNMISTGSFLTETGASNKQSELVKKLTAAWEKKNSKTARAGGASLMALSLAACGGEDNTPFSQADVDAAKAEGVASVDITSDNTDVMLAQADYDAAIATATTSNDADIAAAAKTEALTAADGTIYATVNAAYDAGSTATNADAIAAALTDASGVAHNNVDAAITSNDASVSATATLAAEASLLEGSNFSTVADLLAAYDAATAPTGAAAVSYTTSTDLLTNLTSANDTITGTYGSVADADVLVDVYSTDNDTANLTVADASNLTISGIENVNIDVRDANATSTVVLDKVSGANNITLSSSYGSTKMEAQKLSDGQKVTFADTDLTTIGVNAGGTSDGASNDAHIVLAGKMTATLTTEASNNDIDGLIIETSGGASTITLTQADDFIASTVAGSEDTEYLTGRGDSNLTLTVNQAAANGLDGAILNNEMSGDATLTVKIDGGTLDDEQIDLSKLAADKIVVADASSGTSGDLKVASGAVLETGVAEVVMHATAITSATAGGSVTYNVKHADAGTDANLTFTSFGTVNIVMAGAAAVTWDDDIKTTYTGIGNSTDLNITTGAAALTMGTIAASASNTLDAITITGGGDFTAETIAANSLTATVEDFAAGDLLIQGATNITASKTVTLDQVDNTSANTGTLTVTAGGNISAADAIGQGAAATDLGNVSLVSTGGSVSVEEIDSDGTITLTSAAGKTVDVTANIAAVGAVTITSGSDIDLDSTVGGSTITLTAASTTVNSTFDGAISGDVILNGDGVTYASVTGDEDITGDVTVQGGASLSMTAGTEILTGTVTHTGSGTVSIQDLAGNYAGADASGAVDIDDTASGAASLVTGSGNDNIVTGDVAAQISTNGGNDVVNAAAVGAGKQVIINTGDGIDTITSGKGVTDILTGGAGTDTFTYTDDTHGGTGERITDFTVGSAGDVLRIDASGIDSDSGAGGLNSDGATVVRVDTTDTGTTTYDATDILLLTGTTYADSNAAIDALNGASGMGGNWAANDAVLVVFADTDGHAYAMGVGDDGSNDASKSDEMLIVRLDNLGTADIALMTTDNFSIF